MTHSTTQNSAPTKDSSGEDRRVATAKASIATSVSGDVGTKFGSELVDVVLIVSETSRPKSSFSDRLRRLLKAVIVDAGAREEYERQMLEHAFAVVCEPFESGLEESLIYEGIDKLSGDELFALACRPDSVDAVAVGIEEACPAPDAWVTVIVKHGEMLLSEFEGTLASHRRSSSRCVRGVFEPSESTCKSTTIAFDRMYREKVLTQYAGGTITWEPIQVGRAIEDEGVFSDLVDDMWLAFVRSVLAEPCCLVCFGWPMYRIGKRLAEAIRCSDGIRITAIYCGDFRNPFFRASPSALKGQRAVVLTDVIRRGGLVKRISRKLKRASVSSISAAAVINLSQQNKILIDDGCVDVHSVYSAEPRPRVTSDELSPGERRQMHFFNPEFCRSTKWQPMSREESRELVTRLMPLARFLGRKGIVRRNFKVEQTHPIYIDIGKLLDIPEARTIILDAAAKKFGTDSPTRRCFAYTRRNKSSRKWAHALQDSFGGHAVGIGAGPNGDFLDVDEPSRQLLVECDEAVLVENVCRTGATARGVMQLVRDNPELQKARWRTLFVIDGMSPQGENRRLLASEMEDVGMAFESLYRFPLPDPVTSIPTKNCITMMLREELREARKLTSKPVEGWRSALEGFLKDAPSTHSPESPLLLEQIHAMHEQSAVWQELGSKQVLDTHSLCAIVLRSARIEDYEWLTVGWLMQVAERLRKDAQGMQQLWHCLMAVCCRASQDDETRDRLRGVFEEFPRVYDVETRGRGIQRGNKENWVRTLRAKCSEALSILYPTSRSTEETGPTLAV